MLNKKHNKISVRLRYLFSGINNYYILIIVLSNKYI